MSNLDRLNEVAAGLPESVLGELVDFAEFLKAKTDPALQARRLAIAQIDADLSEGLNAFEQGAVVPVEEALKSAQALIDEIAVD